MLLRRQRHTPISSPLLRQSGMFCRCNGETFILPLNNTAQPNTTNWLNSSAEQCCPLTGQHLHRLLSRMLSYAKQGGRDSVCLDL